jgi:hypothetical protein
MGLHSLLANTGISAVNTTLKEDYVRSRLMGSYVNGLFTGSNSALDIET